MTRAQLLKAIKSHPNAGEVPIGALSTLRVSQLRALLEKVQDAHGDYCYRLAAEQEHDKHRAEVNKIYGEPIWEETAPLGPPTHVIRGMLWSLANAYMPMAYEIEKARLIRRAYDRWQKLATAAETGMHDGLVTKDDADEAFDEMCSHIRRVRIDRHIFSDPDLGERTVLIGMLEASGYVVTKKEKDTND